MQVEIKIELEVDCNEDITIKETVEEWILDNLPHIWGDEDAIIETISISE